jgi:hypothetical protein
VEIVIAWYGDADGPSTSLRIVIGMEPQDIDWLDQA